MNSDSLSSLASRAFVAVASVFLVVAVIEKLCNIAGYTLLRGWIHSNNLLEYAVVLLIFVLALVLRQVRDRLHAG